MFLRKENFELHHLEFAALALEGVSSVTWIEGVLSSNIQGQTFLIVMYFSLSFLL